MKPCEICGVTKPQNKGHYRQQQNGKYKKVCIECEDFDYSEIRKAWTLEPRPSLSEVPKFLAYLEDGVVIRKKYQPGETPCMDQDDFEVLTCCLGYV